MIYLIKSATFDEFEDGTVNFYFALKIGFTSDETGETRFTMYRTNNCGFKVLKTIPGATLVHEKMLHKLLESYRFKNTVEWYNYEQKIIDMFDTLTVGDLELMKKHDSNIFSKYGLTDTIAESTKTVVKQLGGIPLVRKLIVFILKDKLPDELIDGKILEDLTSKYPIPRDLKKNYLIPKYGKDYILSVSKRIRKKTIYASDILRKFKTIKVRIDSFKYLYDERCKDKNKFDKEVLPLLTNIVSNFILIGNLITDEEWNSNKTVNTSRLFEKKIGDNKDPREIDDIKDEIYQNFRVGDRFTYFDIKYKLENIFNNHSLTITPVASIIKKYFEVKIVKASSIKDSTKKSNGF
jgi:hypothetical protein